ncbi:helix-turn-helix domain-containing protein [Planococcus kocurii]|uniref:helix-turn-helix domain-containing protein n=1 Tax=Planococcus kocurii TaxID=1374 RepID=UPI003D01659C
MSLGSKIKKLRDREGIQQKDFAKKIGVSNVVLSRYESDERKPDYDTLQKIADYFEVTTDYLLGREEKKYPAWGDEAEFEDWVNDPTVDKFYKEFKESPEERKKALLAVWEILKTQNNNK